MSEATALDLDSDEVRALTDIGFMALMRGYTKGADALFKGVRAARPREDAGHIGEALLLMQKGEVGAAVTILRARPPSDANRVFLGMALLRQGESSQAHQILRDIVATAQEPALIEMARDLLASPRETNQNFMPR